MEDILRANHGLMRGALGLGGDSLKTGGKWVLDVEFLDEVGRVRKVGGGLLSIVVLLLALLSNAILKLPAMNP